ncbi:MAG TPA: DUF1559 domain-containing protein, partial [Pirellulaceae bacterium]
SQPTVGGVIRWATLRDTNAGGSATTLIPRGLPGATALTGYGYSWLVKLLPYMEETALYNSCNAFRFCAADTTGTPPTIGKPFNSAINATPIIGTQGSTPPPTDHASSNILNALVCPSFAGQETTDIYPLGTLLPSTSDPAALANYAAVAGTHRANIAGRGNGGVENGAIVSGGVNTGRGNGSGDLRDGTSKTMLCIETKDEDYGSWYDGQAAFVVVTAYNTSTIPTVETFTIGSGGVPGNLPTNMVSALNYTPRTTSEPFYWPGFGAAQGTSGTRPRSTRAWGPSSEHSGGIVVAGAADGHVMSLPDSTDLGVIFSLASKAGGESPATDF